MENKSTYIMSLEGTDIYNHMYRNDRHKNINKNYVGMTPYSLELNKLNIEHLKVKTNNKTGKQTTDDVINVKFKQKVLDGESLIKKLYKKIKKIDKKVIRHKEELKLLTKDSKEYKKLQETIDKTHKYVKSLEEYIKLIEKEITEDKWREIKNDELRKKFYTEGFAITEVDEETGEILKENKYVVYKRTSAKSRTGKCLFIKESLYKSMITWSRMGLNFQDGKEYDYAALLSYESLVSSSLEDTIHINVDNILIVDDVISKFPKICNVVRVNEKTGFLDSFEEEYNVENNLFDGEGLLSSEYFKNGQSMILLRQHMFKDAAFNTNIIDFMRDNCPEGQDFDTWELMNRFGETMLAKNVKMIITPTSLKALKFAKDKGMSEKEMWNHWKKVVKADGCIFGICKHEKESKRGYDDNGNVLQQTSYQMLNSIPFSPEDVSEITTYEKEYIDKLKNDDKFFIDYLIYNANEMNCNLMMADLAKHNKDFIYTEIFRGFRTAEISKYVKHVKRGKVRLIGDYCVALGNPMEYLYHAIGQLDINDPKPIALKDNEIYTRLFDEIELVAFRNPNTSPSNVLLAKNKKVKDIDMYFNLTKNIMCCNAIQFPIQDIASSMDYDSDSMVIFNNQRLKEVVKDKVWGKYHPCINAVEADKKSYLVNKENMAVIDNQLSESQRNIGECVNAGQMIMSTYWDLLSPGKASEELLKKVDVATVLSCICIDLAKKMYAIEIKKEIQNLSKGLGNKKPLFFKYISQSKNIGKGVEMYNTPMDYLYKEMSKLGYADDHKNIELIDLLVKRDLVAADRKQEKKIINYVEEMCNKINYINATMKSESEDNEEKKERNNALDNTVKYYKYYIQKATIKEDTMYSILYHMIKNNKSDITLRLMNVLYSKQKETFIKAFIGQ
ncbi:hypothetical protein JOC70_000712 [Clostridium pascui]|uniref:hypothetical protein n=1 Tax=Clostridium pascui TaxID=46609 RepID=UPI00195DE27E|nr:hypothetical protein [Clostridium pascui]MBM7869243.1 hypothetical protein [Clostridium pascui]